LISDSAFLFAINDLICKYKGFLSAKEKVRHNAPIEAGGRFGRGSGPGNCYQEVEFDDKKKN